MTDEEKARFETNAVFLCREISKETGQIAVYELDMPVDGHTIFCLRIRQQFNPELRYFAVGANFYAENKSMIFAALKKAPDNEGGYRKPGCYCRTGKINRRKEVQNMGKPKKKPLPAYFKKSLGLQIRQKQAARRKAAMEAKKADTTKKQ